MRKTLASKTNRSHQDEQIEMTSLLIDMIADKGYQTDIKTQQELNRCAMDYEAYVPGQYRKDNLQLQA